MSELSSDQLWQAVVSRDYRFYSSLVYAVKSTKIFCRPTCPSRKPTRNGVEFFSSPEFAKKAGYRACLRCKPDLNENVPEAIATIQRVCSFIEENYDSKISLSKLSDVATQSPFHLHRSFKKITGVTPREYLEAVRVKHAKLALKRGESTRSSTYAAGHSSASWLYPHQGPSKIGVPPSIYKSGGDGLSINYTIADCSLGRVLVAGTNSGVCFVCLGNADDKLLAHLQNEYPNATISKQDSESSLEMWLSKILEYLEGKTRLGEKSLPIDVASTAFQMRVWKELQSIPYGKTLSYNEVAQRIGNPKAYRAVANACASNRVPLVIPCHRVVRKNGELGGYRWGVERKEKLLSMEAESSSEKQQSD
jgi:AraC family transcriptional regulator of adaptative response/methylated-DNA-[protein]-cysteine methyltransferase